MKKLKLILFWVTFPIAVPVMYAVGVFADLVGTRAQDAAEIFFEHMSDFEEWCFDKE